MTNINHLKESFITTCKILGFVTGVFLLMGILVLLISINLWLIFPIAFLLFWGIVYFD